MVCREIVDVRVMAFKADRDCQSAFTGLEGS